MIDWRLLCCITALVVAGCGRDASLSPLGETDTVLAFGDSLTYGTGVERGASYPDRLARSLGITVINAGVPGELASHGAARLPALLEQHDPALVVLCHGGNDILRRRPMDALESALRDMIETARASGAEVVMLGVPGRNLGLRAPAVYERVADALAVPADVDTLSDLISDRRMKSDQVHLNAAGYARLAQAVHELIAEHGGVLD